MQTLDGLAYEFQQVGEYILASNGGDFVVHARSGPYNGSSTAATFHAVAANVVGDRFGYYVGSNESLRINGNPVAVPAGGLLLAHGGRVTRSSGGYEVLWPSGESLRVAVQGSYLDLIVTTPDRTRAYVGLVGTWDGNALNDLVTRDGVVLTWPVSQSDVYGVFGDSWRITQAESLFDYDLGQDTTTFTDDAFPSHIVTAHTLPTEQFNAAHDACVDAGLTDATQLENCILDVAVSGGDNAVAQAAAEATLPPPVAKVEFSGYFQSFEGADDGRFTPSARYAMLALDALAPTQTLGLIGGGQEVTLTLSNLPAHSDVSVAFDTHVIGPWAGETFQAASEGLAFTTTSFSNTAATQAFPDQLLAGEHPAQSGALATGSLNGESKAVYHHSYTFAHSSSSLTLTFQTPFLPGGASFALDNVAVVTGAVGDPWDPKCTPTGPSLDDQNACTLDFCDPGLGAVHLPRAAGTSCSDGDLCNGEESCNGAGSCVGTPPAVDDGNLCTDDSCDPVVGVIHVPSAAGTSCSNGNHCDGLEMCDGASACLPGTPPDPGTLLPDTNCNTVDEDCDGTADDDYSPGMTLCGIGACATTGELHCVNGQQVNDCASLLPSPSDPLCDTIDEDCDGAADEDYPGTCNGLDVTVCLNGTVEIQSCDDGDLCTDDGCSSGACVNAALSCNDANACTTDGCEPGLGTCTSAPTPGVVCSDGDLCTSGDGCDAAGACVATATVNPDDGNPCTGDSCDSIAGVAHAPLTGPTCTDGNACTQFDLCEAGMCVGGVPVMCVALDPCHLAGTCDPLTGLCSDPNAPDGTACDDGSMCTSAEACQSGGCTGSAVSCDDGEPCTSDACDPAQGCTSSPASDGTLCDDGNPANEADVCKLGLCLPATERLTELSIDDPVVVGGSGHSRNPKVSSCAIGRIVAFESLASNLVTDDTNGGSDIFVHDRATGLLTRVSVGAGGVQGNNPSWGPAVSANGRYVAFLSTATTLVSDGASGQHVYVHDRVTAVTERISVSSAGVPGVGPSSSGVAISDDGRYVAFDSLADNLVPGDTNVRYDIFVRDRVAGTTARVSLSSGDQQGNGDSFSPALSSDGQVVAFVSLASNLVTGDGNGRLDVFTHLVATGVTERVSVTSSGAEGLGDSFQPALSSDGRHVAFHSTAALIPGDTNNRYDVYVRDRSLAVTEHVSVASDGSPSATAESLRPSISGDGRYVVFDTLGDFVAGDTNGRFDVYLRDRALMTTVRLSVSPGGTQGSADSAAPSISADGNCVTFYSASALLPGDVTGLSDIFVLERDTGLLERVSVRTYVGLMEGNGVSDRPGIGVSADGRVVVFDSMASNLVPGDTNVAQDVFVYDGATGQIARISVDGSGAQGSSHSHSPSVSADGRYVAFVSMAPNLIGGAPNQQVVVSDLTTGTLEVASVDFLGAPGPGPSFAPSLSADGRYVAFFSTNDFDGGGGQENIYVRDRAAGTTERVNVTWDFSPVDGPSWASAISADGRYVAFASLASNLVLDDFNFDWDVFVRDRVTGLTERIGLSHSSTQVAISADGTLVAFESFAPLAPGDENFTGDVYGYDRSTGLLELVRGPGQVVGNSRGYFSSLSADGRYVALLSYATNWGAGLPVNIQQVFVHDRDTLQTVLISASRAGVPGEAHSWSPAIAPDGGYVVFGSTASQLIPNDTNGLSDIFLAPNPLW